MTHVQIQWPQEGLCRAAQLTVHTSIQDCEHSTHTCMRMVGLNSNATNATKPSHNAARAYLDALASGPDMLPLAYSLAHKLLTGPVSLVNTTRRSSPRARSPTMPTTSNTAHPTTQCCNIADEPGATLLPPSVDRPYAKTTGSPLPKHTHTHAS